MKNGKAEIGEIIQNEEILEINGKDTSKMMHLDAKKLIKNTGFSLNLILSRAGMISHESNDNDVLSNLDKTPPTYRKQNFNNRNVKILRTNSSNSLVCSFKL